MTPPRQITPLSGREKVDAARIVVEAISGLHVLADAASLPFLGYLIRMVEEEAASIVATGSHEAGARD